MTVTQHPLGPWWALDPNCPVIARVASAYLVRFEGLIRRLPRARLCGSLQECLVSDPTVGCRLLRGRRYPNCR